MSSFLFDGRRLLKDAAVLINGENVLDVGSFRNLQKAYPGTVIVDLGSGVLFPGFVNLHTHLELGYLKGRLPKAKGFVEWLKSMILIKRENIDSETLDSWIKKGIDELKKSGVAVVGDISNTLASVEILKKEMPHSMVFYENYSLRKDSACKKKAELETFKNIHQMKVSLTPHSLYSSHPCLMSFLCRESKILSLHFLESEEERLFFSKKGDLYRFFKNMELLDSDFSFSDHWDFLEKTGCLLKDTIFVHCVFADKRDMERIKSLNGTVCLCLRSNYFITTKLPDVYELNRMNLNLAIGTDSLSSNWNLNFIEEMSFIKRNFPLLASESIFSWAILGGARALKMKWGFFKDFKASPVFVPADSANPLDFILDKGAKTPLSTV